MTHIARTTVTGLVTRIAVAALAGSATAATQATPASRDAKPQKPGTLLIGSAGGKLPYPGYEGHPVKFTFKATPPADGDPMKAGGRFPILHKTAPAPSSSPAT